MPTLRARMDPGREKPAFRSAGAGLKLDPSRMLEYRATVEGIMRSEGPSKSKVTIMAKKSPQPLIAGINPDNWDVEFIIREGLEFAGSPALSRFMDALNITDPIKEMLRNVAHHEIGHWEYPRNSGFGCPFDKPLYYDSFIEPIHDELRKSGKFGRKFCEAMGMRLANAVTDVINNSNVSRSLSARGQSFCGQTLFWELQGQEAGGRYSEEYSLFVKLNLAIFGTRLDHDLLRRHIAETPQIGMSVKRLSRLFTDENMADRGKWETLARVYAREAIPLLKEDEGQQSLQYSPDDETAGPAGGSGGAGGNGGTPGKKEGGGPQPQQAGDDLSQGDIERIMAGRKAGQGIPFYLKTEPALDAYYRGLARKIPLKASGRMPSARLPLIPLLHEPFDPEAHDPADASMQRLFIDPLARRVLPSIPRQRAAVDVPIRKEKRDLPDFLMTLIDSSGSMMEGGDKSLVPWGDRSYYHYALLTFYGMLRFFEVERLLHKIDLSAAIFSDKTLNASGLDEVKRLILNPSSGGTTLDIARVVDSFQGRENAVFSMISDGEIANWAAVRDDFIKLARRNQFFMIQIGRPSSASSDLKAAGLPVHDVGSHQDIVRLAVDLTVRRYHSAIAGGAAGEVRKYRNLF